ncbi:MAG: radical SAM protein [Fusobacteriaceae bacterium]
MFKKRLKSHHDVKDVINSKIKRKLATPFALRKILNSDPIEKDGGIYVHTPYCDKICSFCNMNRKQVDNDLEEYTEYLIKNMDKLGQKRYIQQKEFSVVFFGGGTPTIFKASQLKRILGALRENFKLAHNCEFTFETTLHNLTDEKLEIMQSFGVNRLSIGVQTFSDKGRVTLNRTYDQAKVIARIKEIQVKFKGLVCIDIIYNYVDETLEEVAEDARILTDLGVASSSFYSLMIHEGSHLSKTLDTDEKEYLYGIELDKKLHHEFLNKSLEMGYSVLEHTKITSGKDSYRYIKNVHQLKDLIPIGIGAGGRIANLEMYNLNKFITFYAKDSEIKRKLQLLSGVTQYHTVDLLNLEKICKNAYKEVFEVLLTLEKYGYITIDSTNKNYSYTLDGTFWGNNISALLVETLFENHNL